VSPDRALETGGWWAKPDIMDLSISDIKNDISEYQERIQTARQKLIDLPAGHLSYPEHKKREKQRRELHADIKHLQQLKSYANEGVALCRQKARYRQ